MPKMAEDRPVRLAHRGAPAFPLAVVGLDESDRDQPVVVAGEHLRSILGRIGKKFEDQAVHGIFAPRLQWQAELQQSVEQPMLGKFNQPPSIHVRGDIEVGNDAVVPARLAEPVVRSCRNQPVASVVADVGAKSKVASMSARARQSSPAGARADNVLTSGT